MLPNAKHALFQAQRGPFFTRSPPRHREMCPEAQPSVQSREQRVNSSGSDGSATYCAWNVGEGPRPSDHFRIHKMRERLPTSQGCVGINR